MNKTARIILIIIAVMIVLCCCVGTALTLTGVVSMGTIMKNIDANSTENPEDVANIAADIADFDIPAGFENPYGMRFASFSAVGYFSPEKNTHIYITQLPENLNLNVEEIIQRLQAQSDKGQVMVNGTEIISVEERPVTIRGQESTLIIKEVVSPNGKTVRVGTLSFQCKQGYRAVLTISGFADSWDDAMVNNFIASFK